MTQPTSLAEGRYLLVEKLGEGGMATVYRAFDQRLQVWRAVKILSPDYADKPKIARRFEAEAQTMALLEHPHIVRVYDVGRDGKHTAYIVMELVEGGCLVDWLEHHGPMPPKMAVAATMEVCDGLGAAHAKGVIHRDIKPHNIMVTAEGLCRVTDFGIARVGDSENSQTKTGSVMGTWGYMAPEQRTNAKGVDVRSDVYAVGATLYTLVTDRMPMDLFAAERDSSILEGVHEELIPILVKSTEYSREDRYADVAELKAALADVLDRLPADPPETPALAIESGDSPAPPDPTLYQTQPEGPAPDASGATILPGEGVGKAWTDPAPTLLPDGEPGDTSLPRDNVVHGMTMPPEEVAVTQPGALGRQSRPVFDPNALAEDEAVDAAIVASIPSREVAPGGSGRAALIGVGAAIWGILGLVLLVLVVVVVAWNVIPGPEPVVPVDIPLQPGPRPDPTAPDSTRPDPAVPDPAPVAPMGPAPTQPEPVNPQPEDPQPASPQPTNPTPTAQPVAVVPSPEPPPPEPVAATPCVTATAKLNGAGNKIVFRASPCKATKLADHQLTVHYRVKGTSSYQRHALPPRFGVWTWGLATTEAHDKGVQYWIDGWGGTIGSAGAPRLIKP